ncbi:MarR family winged helix-turn-helix transcriptional regulator [Arthrobacter sp. HS15c]|uniref:MarR family winged helix-turn-helix transcriptional regulator n=1 Tax=Arthrobacter sp. HS15c TaxID=3230279 RepID=UPI00346755D2
MAELKDLYHDLVRFETELWAALDARLRRDCELQLTWFEVMQFLSLKPRRRVHDIAKEFAISAGGVSKVIDRIEEAGYCHRVRNPDDRRSSLLELTKSGELKLRAAMPAFEDELERRFSAVLGHAELERMSLNLKLLRVGAPDRSSSSLS